MVRVLYLGGLGRSGTTLLERLLGQLPGVCPLGELVHLWDRDVRDDERCACGTRFSGCPFWQAVGERAFGGWRHVRVNRILALRAAVERTRHIPALAGGRLSAVRRTLVEEYAGYYSRVYAAAGEVAAGGVTGGGVTAGGVTAGGVTGGGVSEGVAGPPVLIDSSKHASLAYCLRYAPDIDLRVAHVVRDSRGVAYSWTKRVTRPESDGSEEMTRYSPARSALLWNTHNAAFGLLRRCGVPVLRIRYEDLLANPANALAALLEFAGVSPSTVDFLRIEDGETLAELGPCHSAAGNPMRFTVGAVPLRHDDAWRSALPAHRRRLVSALTAPMLGRYGYLEVK